MFTGIDQFVAKYITLSGRRRIFFIPCSNTEKLHEKKNSS